MLKNRCIHNQSFFFVLGGQNVQYCAFHPSCPWRFALSCHLVCASQNLALLKIPLYFFQCFWLTHSLSIPKQKAGERQMWSDTGERVALLPLPPCHLKELKVQRVTVQQRNVQTRLFGHTNSLTIKPSVQLIHKTRKAYSLVFFGDDLSHFCSHWYWKYMSDACCHKANKVFRAILA